MSEAFLRFSNVRDDEEPPQRPEPARPRGHQEYPKWVSPIGGGEAVIVQDAAEEVRVAGRPLTSLEPTPAPVPSLPVRVSIATPPPEPEVAGPAKAAIAGRLIRAARGLLDWSQADLAQRAGLSLPTIRNLEKAADGEMRGSPESVAAIEAALSDAGVRWYDGKGQLGVWMPKREG